MPTAERQNGTLRWWISCDESGMHGGRFYGFGSLWMRYQRRGEFNAMVDAVRARHGYEHEFKWTRITPASRAAYADLVEQFFQTPWLAFHCIVFPKAIVRRELHRSEQEMFQKHFTLLLTHKIRRCHQAHQDRRQTFRVWVDPLPNSYAKASEVVHKITKSVLLPVFKDSSTVHAVNVKDSKSAPSIQLSDVLLGAVMSEWEGKATAAPKLAVRAAVASHLGWKDLRADTDQGERKFNVWMFHDPTRGVRTATRRPVTLLYPLRRP
jgi:hypothetical protein